MQRLGIEVHIAGHYERAFVLYQGALERFQATGNMQSLILHQGLPDRSETAALLGQLASLVTGFRHTERVARLLGAAEGLTQLIP